MHFLLEIENFLSEEECKKFMEMIDYDPKKKYVEKGELTKYWRVIWDNKEFADELFKRLKDGNYLPGDGKKYKCCNSVFRIAKYDS